MKIGIIGLPNVGKSTLFKTLTKKDIDIANYPFCTIDPNIGIVKIPDKRLENLARIFNSKKIINTVIEFVDIAGLVKGASKGEGLGNEFLSNIASVDAILQVVRFFEDKNIKHVSNKLEVKKDIETINLELILKDIAQMESAVKRLSHESKNNKKESIEKYEFAKKLLAYLKKENLAKDFIKFQTLSKNENDLLKELNLLTAKPMMFLFNISESESVQNTKKKLQNLNLHNLPHVILSAKMELDIMDLKEKEKKELGVGNSLLPELISQSYKLLNLLTFLTTGPDETKAWTIKKGTKAPEAGAVIHTDFKKTFIRAKVISYEDLMSAGSMHKAQEQGKLRTEGKDYVVQEGDVIEFVV